MSPVGISVKPYHRKRQMLSLENDCIYYRNLLVIPDNRQPENKHLARQYIWWDTIDQDIEKYM